MKKLHNPSEAQGETPSATAPIAVHAICAALVGKEKGISVIDAKQMLFSYLAPSQE